MIDGHLSSQDRKKTLYHQVPLLYLHDCVCKYIYIYMYLVSYVTISRNVYYIFKSL